MAFFNTREVEARELRPGNYLIMWDERDRTFLSRRVMHVRTWEKGTCVDLGTSLETVDFGATERVTIRGRRLCGDDRPRRW